MKVGFTLRETYSMYRSLAREAFAVTGFDGSLPRFTAAKELGAGIIGQTEFTMVNPWANEWGPANYVRVDRVYLDYLWEDELIGVMLHELAHVIAGYEAAHKPEWSDISKSLGGHWDELLIPREWSKLPGAYNPGRRLVDRVGVWYEHHA